MNFWWKKVVRDYLTFTKRERNALVAVLTVLIVFFVATPYLFRVRQRPVVSPRAFANELARLQISVDSSNGRQKPYYADEPPYDYMRPRQQYPNNRQFSKGELFAFDPNTVDADGWKRLGVKDRTVQTIQNFLAKGYRFKQPADLQKIYGMPPALAARLAPFVRIAAAPPVHHAVFETEAPAKTTASRSAPALLDINTADTAALIALPGIGSRLAARIILFRDKLGGFVSVEQMGETYGIADSVFKKISPRLRCSSPTPRTININIADVATLKAHPYISWNVANALVQYRGQHGNFASVADIKKIMIIDEAMYARLQPYLSIE